MSFEEACSRIQKMKFLQEWNFTINNSQMVLQKKDPRFTLQYIEIIADSSLGFSICFSFLLSEGMEFVLTERFCQDTVEQYFIGNQRSLAGRSENPNLYEFGYNDNAIFIFRKAFPVIVVILEEDMTKQRVG